MLCVKKQKAKTVSSSCNTKEIHTGKQKYDAIENNGTGNKLISVRPVIRDGEK